MSAAIKGKALARRLAPDEGTGMKGGDWVFFKTRNWPKDVCRAPFESVTGESVTGEAADVTGERLYSGRGKIVGIVGDNYTVREEKSNRLVEVDRHPDDHISP